jgi:hypothetical protein
MIAETTVDQLSQECGVSYGPALQLINQLQAYTTVLLDSSTRSIDLMSCPNIVPLYTTAVYDGVCNTCIQSATWIFASFFVIAFFGMIMIMFRGSIYPVGFFSDEQDSDDDDAEKEDIGTGSSEEEEAEGEDNDNEESVFANEQASTAYGQGSIVSGRRQARLLDKVTSDADDTVRSNDFEGSVQTGSVYGDSQYTENQSVVR